jgi:hypothetical protein
LSYFGGVFLPLVLLPWGIPLAADWDLKTREWNAIWKGVRCKEVDYPKFTDLYWKMIHMCVRTGEEWTPYPNYPICKELTLTLTLGEAKPHYYVLFRLGKSIPSSPQQTEWEMA